MTKINLEVGKTYIDSNNVEVKIINKFESEDGACIYLSDNDYCYFNDGYRLDNTNINIVKEKEKETNADVKIYNTAGIISITKKEGNVVKYESPNPYDAVTSSLTDTGNGYIAKFDSKCSTTQDYYICLDYGQAEELMMMLMHAMEGSFCSVDPDEGECK